VKEGPNQEAISYNWHRHQDTQFYAGEGWNYPFPGNRHYLIPEYTLLRPHEFLPTNLANTQIPVSCIEPPRFLSFCLDRGQILSFRALICGLDLLLLGLRLPRG
jgi:hypothetical protein